MEYQDNKKIREHMSNTSKVVNFAKVLFTFTAISLSTGCMIILPTSSTSTNQSADEIAERIEYYGSRCWSSLRLPIDKDIAVKKYETQRGFKVTASRMEGSTPQYPFLHVTITRNGSGSDVVVREGEFNLGSALNLSDDVQRWINGDSGC